MVLIYVSLMANDIECLFMCYFLSAYHWRDALSCLLLVFYLDFFFFLLLRFENSLHILDISSSSDTWFTNNVLLVCSLSFHPPNRSFAEKKFLILIKYNVSVFPFIDCAFDVKSKNTLPSTRSQRFSLIHFPKVL